MFMLIPVTVVLDDTAPAVEEGRKLTGDHQTQSKLVCVLGR